MNYLTDCKYCVVNENINIFFCLLYCVCPVISLRTACSDMKGFSGGGSVVVFLKIFEHAKVKLCHNVWRGMSRFVCCCNMSAFYVFLH